MGHYYKKAPRVKPKSLEPHQYFARSLNLTPQQAKWFEEALTRVNKGNPYKTVT